MNFTHIHYVPCLRWNMGEYQAVWRLSTPTRQKMTPLIEVPKIRWDFQKRRYAKTIDEHLDQFPNRVHKKWKGGPVFVDLINIRASERMASGIHPVRFVFDELRDLAPSAVPVSGIERDAEYQKGIREAIDRDGLGVCLRVRIEQAASSSFGGEVESFLSKLEIEPIKCDLVLDLCAPNFVPITGFARIIRGIVKALPHLPDWRTFTLLGTSFVHTMAEVEIGGQVISRYEWELYEQLISDFNDIGLRLPSFGDYAISHPDVIDQDMRLLKPSAKIRYTIDNGWYVVKGRNVRDERFGKFEQYRELCRIITRSPHYCGSNFSWGDQYIKDCADGSGKTGSLTMWVEVDTNHHIEKVTQDIASLYAS